jgi:hypothetical protein
MGYFQRQKLTDASAIGPNVSVREPNHVNPLAIQIARAPSVATLSIGMFIPIDLNGKPHRCAIEVDHVRPNWMLSPKFYAELSAPQIAPESSLNRAQ